MRFLFLFFGLMVCWSCRTEMDAPPDFIEPDVASNTTIKLLKARHSMGALEQITEDLVIEGIVVANDRTGNFYKSIVIQDGTGGITLHLDDYHLYTAYPEGRKLFIKMKGLYLGDYNGLIQVGGGIDSADAARPSLSPVAPALFEKHIFKGSTGHLVHPVAVDITALHDSLQSRLVQLKEVEFVSGDIDKTYAYAQGGLSRNLTLKNCTGGTVLLRSSGFSSFANVNVPDGNGSVTAVLSVFGTTRQLVIRDISDVRLYNDRCGSGLPPPVGTSFHALFDFGSVTSASGMMDPTPLPLVQGLHFLPFKASGVGGVQPNPTSSGRFSFTDWPTGATNNSDVFTGSIHSGKYFEVSVQPQNGTVYHLLSMQFKVQRSGTGPRQWIVRASLDNYSSNLPAVIEPSNAALSVIMPNVFQIADGVTSSEDGVVVQFGSPFSGLTQPVTFRIYAFNAEAGGGSFSIDDVKISGVVL